MSKSNFREKLIEKLKEDKECFKDVVKLRKCEKTKERLIYVDNLLELIHKGVFR